jgi:hypothetical protein
MWESKVPVSTVQGDGDKWMDDAETFQGPTPPRLCGCGEGRKIPAVPVLRDANEPAVPGTHQHKGVPGGEGKTTPAGHGSQVSTCFASTIHGARGRFGTGRGFRYLGRLLLQDDDDVQAVRNQLCKARGTWARIGQVL